MRLRPLVLAVLVLAPLVGMADDGLELVRSWPRERSESVPARAPEERVDAISFVGSTTSIVYGAGSDVWFLRGPRGVPVHVAHFARNVTAVAPSRDGLRVAVAFEDVDTLSVVDLKTGRRLAAVASVENARYVSWSPDDARILSASRREVCVASVESSSDVERRGPGRSVFVGATYTDAGPRVLEISWYRKLDVAAATSRTVYKTFELTVTSEPGAVALSDDGRTLGVREEEGLALLSDGAAPVLVRFPEAPRRFAVSHDGKSICVAGAKTNSLLFKSAYEADAAPGRHVGAVTAIALSPDGQRAVSTGIDGTARLWDTESGEHLHRVECGRATGPVEFSTDGTRVFVATAYGVAVVESSSSKVLELIPGADAPWRGETARVASAAVALRDATKHGLSTFALTRDGQRALVVTSELELWDMKTLARVRVYENCPAVRGAVAVSPDGKRGVAFHVDRQLRLWSLEGSWAIASVDASEIGVPSVITFAPSGEWLLVGTTDGRFHKFALPKGD